MNCHCSGSPWRQHKLPQSGDLICWEPTLVLRVDQELGERPGFTTNLFQALGPLEPLCIFLVEQGRGWFRPLMNSLVSFLGVLIPSFSKSFNGFHSPSSSNVCTDCWNRSITKTKAKLGRPRCQKLFLDRMHEQPVLFQHKRLSEQIISDRRI